MPDKKNPWGNGGKNGNDPVQGPWGSKNGSGGGGHDRSEPPHLDEMLRMAQKNFNDIFPTPNGFGPGKIAAILIAVLIVLWGLSGFYFIQPNEHGVVLTFGEYTRTDEQSGLKYHFPSPFQTVEIVNVTNERRIEVGFRNFRGQNVGAQTEPMRSVPEESLMLTGDENIIDINFVVLWRIGDAKNYLFKIRDPEATIKIVAESAMREIIGRKKIQEALTKARSEVQADTKKLMQNILDEYESGVHINNVQLQKVDPPSKVVDAFNEVQRARQEKEQLRNRAEAYRNDILPRARGEAEKLRQQAEAYKQEVVNRASGDAERFKSVYAAYKKSKTVTSERIYLETMESILQNTKNIIMAPGQNGQGVIPYLPLNDLKRNNNNVKKEK